MSESIDLEVLYTITHSKKHAINFVNNHNETLFDPDYWKMAKNVFAYIKAYKEVPTLQVMLDSVKKADAKFKPAIIELWNQIESAKSDPSEFNYKVDKLKKRYKEKEIFLLKESLSQEGLNSSDSIKKIKKSLQDISSHDEKKTFTRVTIKDAVTQFRETYNHRVKNPNLVPGIKTGYKALDNATGGFLEGDLVVVAGESSTGKSVVLMNLAIQMFMQQNTLTTDPSQFTKGKDILYFSLEMPFEACFNRLLARLARVPMNKIKSAKIPKNSPELERIKVALNFLENYPYQFEIVDMPAGSNMEAIDAVYQDYLTYASPGAVVIDYMGIMGYDDDKMDDWLKLGEIARVLHEFARSNGIPVLSAVQLNRAKQTAKEAEELIGLHRIGRSALIATHVTHLIQIVKRAQERQLQDMHLALIKNRDGATPDFKVLKDFATSTILDQDISEEEMEFFDEDDIEARFEEIGEL